MNWTKFLCGDRKFIHRLVVVLGVLSISLSAGCGSKKPEEPLPEVTMDDLEKRADGLYLKDAEEKFDGWLVEYYPDPEEGSSEERQLKSRSRIQGGVLNGISEGWYGSGTKQVEEHFVQGVSHGVRTKWYSSGKKQSEEIIVEGELNGLVRKWHENGQLAEEMTLVNGKPDGLARSWSEDGELKAEVELKMGEVIRQEFKNKSANLE